MSVGKNFFLSERKSRLNWLLKMIQENPKTPFHKLKGSLMLKTGLRGNTIDEYIRDLENGGIIEFDNETRNYKVLL